MKLFLISLFVLVFSACTADSDGPLPDKKKYEDDADLMLNICKKFSEEPEAKKLHTSVVAVQAARLVSCSNFNDECNIYGRCLTVMIESSKDGEISPSERADMKKVVLELKTAISEGKIKLNAELKKRKNQ